MNILGVTYLLLRLDSAFATLRNCADVFAEFGFCVAGQGSYIVEPQLERVASLDLKSLRRIFRPDEDKM